MEAQAGLKGESPDQSRAEPSQPEGKLPSRYVGIGASAGGLEALDTFFSRMPPDSGFAFIVIQHLSPDYKSLMVELLSKRTTMAVRRAEEGMQVEGDTVYLIPPKKHLTIFHGRLILTDLDPGRGINLPIDVFLRSLAEDQAEKAIGIILSGTGSDGVRGIRSIKEAGGLVLVQSEESARFNGMPRAAVATGLADVVLSPEEMPDKLLMFTRRDPLAPVDRPRALLSDEDGLARIFSLLREQTRVDFTFYKPNTVLRRIERRMTVNQAQDLREYVRFLESRSGEVMTLYRELLIGVTSFFRDREVFDELGDRILPALLDNADHREIRFWVAGCSTGEEAYSLAILARDCMERVGGSRSVKIFATDIDRDAILHAGNGLYPESIAADLPSGVLSRHFVRRGDLYQVQRSIREMVVFAQHNLIKDPPFTNIDLLSCRNLLIYLQPVLQQRVMEYVNFSLNPQGVLLLGTSETPGEMADYFDPLHHRHKIYRSKGRKRPPAEGPQFQAPADALVRQRGARFGRAGHISSQLEEERHLDRVLQSLAEELVSLVAVVNERLELLHLAGDPEGFLKLQPGKICNDISRMAIKELAIPLSTGLQKVFQSGTDIKYTNIRLPHQGRTRVMQMRIRLLPGRKGQEPLAGVYLQEMPGVGRDAVSATSQEYDLSREAEQRIQDLEQELQFTKENLQATIEELETSNEELQATNEELLASNEELQSTNEELQSVNEELHTVNAEYHSKILELTEMTNDLENLMAATRIGTLFLDENLEVRKFTPELARLFRVLPGDVGRPLSHLTHHLVGVDILAVLRKVEEENNPWEQEVCTTDGAWFLMRVLPYEIGAGAPSGFVLTFTDIGPVKRTEEEIRLHETRLRSLVKILQHEARSTQELLDHALNEAIQLTGSRFGYIYHYHEDRKQFVLNTWSGEVMEVCAIADPQTCYELDKTGIWGEAVRQQRPIILNDFQADHPLKRGYPAGHAELHSYLTIPVFKEERIVAVVGVANKETDYTETDVLQLTLLMDSVFKVAYRKEAEEALRCSHELLHAAMNPSLTGIWEWDAGSQEMFWTDEVYRIHGMDPGEEGFHRRSLECFGEADRHRIASALDRCCETGAPYALETDLTDVSGGHKRVRIEAQAVRRRERIIKVLGNMKDITPATVTE
ncbi:MAG: chemotaxis protein CheB [Syntrophobacteraceae bacterium]